MNEFKKIVEKHSLDNIDDIFDGNALAGEIGEVCNVLKKMKFYEDIPDYKKKVDSEIGSGLRLSFQEQLIDEMGDSLFYFFRIMIRNGITLEQILEAQEHKLIGQSISLEKTFKK